MTTELQQQINAAREQYRRLIGSGYDRPTALRLIGDSFRDVLRKRRPLQTTPVLDHKNEGEEKYDTMAAPTTQQRDVAPAMQETQPQPVLGQKIVAQKDIGRVVWIGPRFVSVAWIKSGATQRIGKRRFVDGVKGGQYVLLPKIRVAGTRTDD